MEPSLKLYWQRFINMPSGDTNHDPTEARECVPGLQFADHDILTKASKLWRSCSRSASIG